MKNELEPNERSINLGDKHFEKGEFSRYMSTAASFHFGGEFVKLFFVVAIIKILIDSQKITDPLARKQTIFHINLCYICMSPKQSHRL